MSGEFNAPNQNSFSRRTAGRAEQLYALTIFSLGLINVLKGVLAPESLFFLNLTLGPLAMGLGAKSWEDGARQTLETAQMEAQRKAIDLKLRQLRKTHPNEVSRHHLSMTEVSGLLRQVDYPEMTVKVVREFARYANTWNKPEFLFNTQTVKTALSSIQQLCSETDHLSVKAAGIQAMHKILASDDPIVYSTRHGRSVEILFSIADSTHGIARNSAQARLVKQAIICLRQFTDRQYSKRWWFSHRPVYTQASVALVRLKRKINMV